MTIDMKLTSVQCSTKDVNLVDDWDMNWFYKEKKRFV